MPNAEPAILTKMQLAGRKAAETRAANIAAGITGPRPKANGAKATPATPRPDGTTLDLLLIELQDRVEIGFRFQGEPSEGEAALSLLRWVAYPHWEESGEGVLIGAHIATLSATHATLAQIEPALCLMRRADSFLKVAREQSDDWSLAFCLTSLGAHFRATQLITRQGDKETAHKRGAAYGQAYKMELGFLARHPAPERDPAPAPTGDPAPARKAK